MLRMLGQNLSKLGRGFHLGVNIRAAPGQFRKVDFMTGSSLRFGYDLSAEIERFAEGACKTSCKTLQDVLQDVVFFEDSPARR